MYDCRVTTQHPLFFKPGMAIIMLSKVRTLDDLHLIDINCNNTDVPALDKQAFRYDKNRL